MHLSGFLMALKYVFCFDLIGFVRVAFGYNYVKAKNITYIVNDKDTYNTGAQVLGDIKIMYIFAGFIV